MLAAMIMGAAAAAGSQEQRQPASGDGLRDWTGGAQLPAQRKMWAEAWLRLWRLRRRLRWPRQRQRRGSYAHIAQHKVSTAALRTKK